MTDKAAPGETHRQLFGILCTYRRLADALGYLDSLERQTRRPDLVIVVDNASDAALAAAIAARTSSIPVIYVDPGANVGPAGAFRLGFEQIEARAAPQDLVVHFDDDDPPVSDTQLAQLSAALGAAVLDDPTVVGIGMSGGVMSSHTGLVRSGEATLPYGDVDHLHGGYLPTYTVEALSAVRSHDPSFFYGFEELELGRRLHSTGRRLLVHTALMKELEGLYPKKAVLAPRGARPWGDADWSRFYKERNLVRVLRRERRWMAISFTVLFRHLLKPLLMLPARRGLAWRRLVLGIRATRAGLRGRSGVDPRYPPP